MKIFQTLFLVLFFSSAAFAQVLEDEAANYGSSWVHGSNFGTGFGPWEINSGDSTGNFIGNPANYGMGTDGIGTLAFGLYASSHTNYVTAFRPFSEPLAVGDRLTFYWAIHWDAHSGNKGFEIRSGNTVVFKMNNSSNETITSSIGTASPSAGTLPMKVTLIRMNSDQYLLAMSRRFVGGGDYFAVFSHTGPINGLNFYCGAQGTPEGQRNLYFNKFKIEKNVYPQGVPNFVLYKWSGALTPRSISIRAKLARPSTQVRLVLSTSSDLSNPIFGATTEVNTSTNLMGAFRMDSLIPNTEYFYALESDGLIDNRPEAIGRFRTAQMGPHSFSFTAGSCNLLFAHPVFNRIREKDPLFMMMLGDIHYMNPNSTDVNLHRRTYERTVLSMAVTRDLYNRVPIAYVWDDHDFSGDNSNSTFIGAESAKQAFREYVPHYPFGTGIVGQNSAIYQSFVIGRVRFIMCDLRSESTDFIHMSPNQIQWFKNECLAAKQANQLICWVSSFGITADTPDSWGGNLAYRQQRNEIFTFLKQANIRNLFVLSGDAHAIGIDDGANTDCAGITETNHCVRDSLSWTPRYPLFQCAPLGNGTSIKGIVTNILPMTGEDYQGQYGKIDVLDNGDEHITVNFTAYRVSPITQNEIVLGTYSFTRQLKPVEETKVLVPQQSAWKYLDNGSDQGIAWTAPNFNDATWNTGIAPFGYSVSGIRTLVSFGSNAQEKHMTTYFRKKFQVNADDSILASQLSLWLDDGAVAYLNGVPIASGNFTHPTWNYQTPASDVVNDQPKLFRYYFNALPLVVGENTLAVEVHQISGASSDLFFDAEILTKVDTANAPVKNTTLQSGKNLKGVFPNPANEKLTIWSLGKPESWTLYSLTGQKVRTGNWPEPNTLLELNLSDLNEGLYFIEVSYKTSRERVKIVIKR